MLVLIIMCYYLILCLTIVVFAILLTVFFYVFFLLGYLCYFVGFVLHISPQNLYLYTLDFGLKIYVIITTTYKYNKHIVHLFSKTWGGENNPMKSTISDPCKCYAKYNKIATTRACFLKISRGAK